MADIRLMGGPFNGETMPAGVETAWIPYPLGPREWINAEYQREQREGEYIGRFVGYVNRDMERVDKRGRKVKRAR